MPARLDGAAVFSLASSRCVSPEGRLTSPHFRVRVESSVSII